GLWGLALGGGRPGLRSQLTRHGYALRADRDGGVYRYPAAAMAAAADHARDRDRAGRDRDDLVRREGDGAAPDPQSGDLEPAAAVRDRAAGDVHGRPEQARRTGRRALGA